MPGPLKNPRQEAFCRERVYNRLSAVAAYKRVGYAGNPKNQAEKVSALPYVRERIREMQAELHTKVVEKELYTRETVIKELLENIQESKRGLLQFKGQVVYLRDPDGELILDELKQPQPVFARDGRVINQALELLGLEKGMFPKISKLEHETKDPFKGLEPEEILLELQRSMVNDLGWEIDMGDLMKLVGMARDDNEKGKGKKPRELGTGTGR